MFDSLTSNQRIGVVWGGAVILLAIFSYFGLVDKTKATSSRKARQAKEMRQAYRSIENRTKSSKAVTNKNNEGSLQISELWIYPIKSIRGCKVPNAMITAEGFYLDRRFMLLKDHEETPQKLQNMHVPQFPAMCLFQTAIKHDNIIVSYSAPGSSEVDTIEIPLEPETVDNLEKVDVLMHSSPTTGFDMGAKYNEWFSKRFGFKVILAFWGGNPRPVLGNRPGKPANVGPKPKNTVTIVLSSVPVLGAYLGDDEDNIAFNDCAPFLVINDASVADVTTRLGEDLEMEPSKFRPNMIVKGTSKAFEEDFWGELTCGGGEDEARIILTGNCGRCASLNVDYNTGEFGKGRDGQVLKLLQKDRRVDTGVKYSPIFGRYGFAGRNDAGKVLRVGDSVVISKKNKQRTKFSWPGISNKS